MWGIPPNIDSRPVFKRGGVDYWKNWENISNLNFEIVENKF